ncbi:MAG: hypothetical protein P8X42_05975 [Calditrichaceae bacterium]
MKYDSASAQITYAAKQLQKYLSDNNYLNDEAFVLNHRGNEINITGGDNKGVIYGVQALIEDIQNGMTFDDIQSKSDSTRLHFRAIKFDLPWDTYRHSSSLYQHQEICKDLNFWEAFLDMMSENRFNALTLWNLHPYTFLIKPENFPEASPWTESEMEEWKNLFKGIFKLAHERGIDTYIMPFNIFVTPEFARAHNVAMNNLNHHHYVQADTSEIIKTYTRQCVTQMLNEYPNLSGIGLTLGEGMGGMTPLEREEWIRETIIEGMCQANRKSKLIHRIPFSGNTGSLGATNIEMEQITRKGIEEEAAMDCFEGPVWASLKFNWSHPLSTTKLIKVHGGKIYGTYWNPKPEGYKIVWTARNEDFFCLRWGVADFIREHIRTNAHDYVGGYFVGSETYIPAKDYFTKPGIDVNWKYAFQRQWLFYKLWGRLLYNSDTPDEVFINEFINRYGEKAAVLFKAYELAGRTPLRLASSFDCTWDFTLYSEGFMALNQETHRVEYISVDRQISHPPLDTAYVSIENYVNTIESGKKFSKERITPPELADMLKNDCTRALELVKDIDTSGDSALMFEVADVKTWANLGLYFSHKIKGAVDLQTFRVTGDQKRKQGAVKHLKSALAYWDTVISITRPIYRDMPLVHLSEQDGKSWQENDHLRFHWALLRPAVEKDIEIAEEAKVNNQ